MQTSADEEHINQIDYLPIGNHWKTYITNMVLEITCASDHKLLKERLRMITLHVSAKITASKRLVISSSSHF